MAIPFHLIALSAMSRSLVRSLCFNRESQHPLEPLPPGHEGYTFVSMDVSPPARTPPVPPSLSFPSTEFFYSYHIMNPVIPPQPRNPQQNSKTFSHHKATAKM